MRQTASASTPPSAKGMRHPHASICAEERQACSTSSRASETSWPEISVTYWKLDQKPRCFRPAISDR